MGLRLEKLAVPTESAIDVMAADELRVVTKKCCERIQLYESLLFKARQRLYGQRSERSEKSDSASGAESTARGKTTKQLSERYPDARVEVHDINFTAPQTCPACGSEMGDSGMSEESEYLDVKSREFIVVNQRRRKHRCGKCHGSIATAACPPRITPRGSYSDALMVDATLSKFCDLTPIDRYTKMAGREGLSGLPPHSLIKASFQLAAFMGGVYALIRAEVLAAVVLRADETPHRMLEGDEIKRWYLWGFSTERACFFECHDTRSGDVSTSVLMVSSCRVLLSDVYSGYAKSIRLTNEARTEAKRELIQAAYCNAHARREFWSKEAGSPDMTEDQKIVIDLYKEIYKLNKESKGLKPEAVSERREKMKPHFEAIKSEAERKIDAYSNKSQMGSAYRYFLNNYDGLTLFLSNPLIPIDNNGSERLLRSPVIGRKTWYGTHSRRGAEVGAIHFTIVETCKLNEVNPRAYYLDAVARIHSQEKLLTPREYKQLAAKGNDTC